MVCDIMLFVLSVGFIIMLLRTLVTFKIYIQNGYLIKQSGKTFKRKNIIMLKNISRIQMLSLHSRLPAFIHLQCYDKSLFVVALNGRQRSQLEKHILQLK